METQPGEVMVYILKMVKVQPRIILQQVALARLILRSLVVHLVVQRRIPLTYQMQAHQIEEL